MSNEVITLLISLLTCVIALYAAFNARKSREIARNALDMSVHQNLRPLRIAVYKTMTEYAYYCSTYRTLQCLKAVDGTNDLIEHISGLKWEIDQYGPLNMPDVEQKRIEFQNKGWQLQKLLDRMAGHDNSLHDVQFETLKDDMHCITDWFAQENKDLKEVFSKYLTTEQSTIPI